MIAPATHSSILFPNSAGKVCSVLNSQKCFRTFWAALCFALISEIPEIRELEVTADSVQLGVSLTFGAKLQFTHSDAAVVEVRFNSESVEHLPQQQI